MTLVVRSSVVPEILIQSHAEHDARQVDSHLKKIASKPNGLRLLGRIKKLSTNGRYVKINTHDRSNTVSAMLTQEQIQHYGVNPHPDDPVHQATMIALARMLPGESCNEGVVSVIKLNLKQGTHLDKYGFPVGPQDNEENNFISLAHELVHAYHLLNGSYYGGDPVHTVNMQNSPMRHEEDRAVGVGRYRGQSLSENAIRLEHGLPLRASYFSLEQLRKYNIL